MVLLLVCLCCVQCGYTLRHRLKESFVNEKGIFVPVFDNRTDETGVERVFTNALIRELLSRREVIIADRSQAGLELKGAVERIDQGPTAFTDPGFRGLQPYRRLPTEMGVTVVLSLSLNDLRTGGRIWSQSFTGFRRVATPANRTYDFEAPSSAGLITQSIVESLYADIARDIMRDVYDDMVELF
ncbi:MAG: hypothetical protein HY537_02660 [Deltaproteobacteria bacterium]|nr:hypothetical protein [Deltaproteobacteria bacterium]